MKTVQEIISAAIETHKAEFRAALIKQAENHDDAASLTRNPRAAQGAIAQRNACLTAYDHVGADNVAAICAEMGTCVVALNVAGKLLGVARPALTAAIVDWQEAREKANV